MTIGKGGAYKFAGRVFGCVEVYVKVTFIYILLILGR